MENSGLVDIIDKTCQLRVENMQTITKNAERDRKKCDMQKVDAETTVQLCLDLV
jgi:hypothetical protein